MTIPVVSGSLACFVHVHVHVILEFICDSVSVCAQLIKVFYYFPKKYIAKLMLQLGGGGKEQIPIVYVTLVPSATSLYKVRVTDAK